MPVGAVLYLPFEVAPSGGAIIDVARGHIVMCRTACPVIAAGQRGNAYAFDAAIPHVLEVPYVADLDASSGFTIATWLFMNTLPTSMYFCVFGKPLGTSDFNTHALCVRNDGVAMYHTGTTAGTDQTTGSQVTVGEWHHLALTWDAPTRRKRGYLDGVLDATRTISVESDLNPITVGADENSGAPAYALDGRVDEVLLFDRALDDAEIQSLAQP